MSNWRRLFDSQVAYGSASPTKPSTKVEQSKMYPSMAWPSGCILVFPYSSRGSRFVFLYRLFLH